MGLSSVSPLHSLLTRSHHILPFGDVHEHLCRPEPASFLTALLPPLQNRHVHPAGQPLSIPLIANLLLSFVERLFRFELLNAEFCITTFKFAFELLTMFIHLL